MATTLTIRIDPRSSALLMLRKINLDELERYMSVYRDFEPIRYLCAKFLGDLGAEQASAAERAREQIETLLLTLAQAGIQPKGSRRRA